MDRPWKFLYLSMVMTVLLLLASSASAYVFDVYGVNYDVSAQVNFSYDPSAGKVSFGITNTSSLTPASLTAFAFNTPSSVSGVSSFSGPSGWSSIYASNGIDTPGQFGKYDIGAITGPRFNGGKVASGIPVGSTYNFSFNLAGSNLNLLNESSFNLLSAPGPSGKDSTQYFIARFQGITEKDFSDVAIPKNPVPIPASLWLLGSGLLGIFGVRKKIRK